MPKTKQANGKQESIEATLWQAADKLRKNMDAAEYKHVVFGLIFLKYISDAFEVLHSKLVSGKGEYEEISERSIILVIHPVAYAATLQA